MVYNNPLGVVAQTNHRGIFAILQVRLMYCEMLGHDTSFGYIHALQFASDGSIATKKAAYLALTQLLHPRHELILLLVNTLLSDLKSDNFVVVCTALSVATRLIASDLVSALYPVVVERLKHPKEAVRKKAVMALHHFVRMDPAFTGKWRHGAGLPYAVPYVVGFAAPQSLNPT